MRQKIELLNFLTSKKQTLNLKKVNVDSSGKYCSTENETTLIEPLVIVVFCKGRTISSRHLAPPLLICYRIYAKKKIRIKFFSKRLILVLHITPGLLCIIDRLKNFETAHVSYSFLQASARHFLYFGSCWLKISLTIVY